jgi:hypothetical protein
MAASVSSLVWQGSAVCTALVGPSSCLAKLLGGSASLLRLSLASVTEGELLACICKEHETQCRQG